MKILLSGATGLIGKELGRELCSTGHEIYVISRNYLKAQAELPFPARIYDWKDAKSALSEVEAVINLAGENIGEGRWTKKRKERILSSRVEATTNIVRAIKELHEEGHSKIKTFISASAIGIYGDRQDSWLTEESSVGDDFLSQVCRQWEGATRGLDEIGIRVVRTRIGMVLSRRGGALDKLLPLFANGLGSAVGTGKQWMSWIHQEDLTHLLMFCLENDTISGPVNAVAPGPVTNLEFSRVLARTLNRSLLPRVPGPILRIVLGEMSSLVLGSQRVSSDHLISQGFVFRYPQLEGALREICTYLKDDLQELFVEQWVPKRPEQIFPFFSNENNLELITPNFLNFKVTGKSTPTIQEGTQINYRLSLYGLPLRWRSQICQWTPGKRFVDNQLKGPYQYWNHTHDFIPFQDGTLLRDRVLYRIPFGRLGTLVAGLKIKADVKEIFRYRKHVIAELFSSHGLYNFFLIESKMQENEKGPI